MPRNHVTRETLAVMATRKHRQGSADRIEKYFTGYSSVITRRTFCGVLVILKTCHLHVKLYEDDQLTQTANETGVTWDTDMMCVSCVSYSLIIRYLVHYSSFNCARYHLHPKEIVRCAHHSVS